MRGGKPCLHPRMDNRMPAPFDDSLRPRPFRLRSLTLLVANSTMGEFNGALGAAALAVHEWKPAREPVRAGPGELNHRFRR